MRLALLILLMVTRVYGSSGPVSRDYYRWERALLNIYVPTPQVWFATGGSGGSGTEASPYRVNTAADLDAIMLGFSDTARTFRFADGTYYTAGADGIDNLIASVNWKMRANWHFIGESQDGVIFKLNQLNYLDTRVDYASSQLFSTIQSGVSGVEICNLTMDCRWDEYTTQLTTSFVQPANGGSVTVSVSDTSIFTVGKMAHAYDPADEENHGDYIVTSKTSSTVTMTRDVTLETADASESGETIDAGMMLAPLSNTAGAGIYGPNALLDHVTVQNTGTPLYESRIGLAFVSGTGLEKGSIMRYCTIRYTHGRYGWGFHVSANNTGGTSNGIEVSARVENCRFYGNGWHQAYASWGATNVCFANNYAEDCYNGFFNDTATNRGLQLLDNEFVNCSGPGAIQLGGVNANHQLRAAALRNTIHLAQGQRAFHFSGGCVNGRFNDNIVTLLGGATSAHGVYAGDPDGNSGNTFTGNAFADGITNTTVPASFTA